MSEYFRAVFAVTAALAVLRLVLYKEKGDIAVRLAFAVLAIYAISVPLFEIVGNTDGELSFDVGEVSGIYGEEYAEVCEAAFCDGVREAVCLKFSLREGSVRVMAEDFDPFKMKAGRVRIFLSGGAVLTDPLKIEKYIEECGLGECDAEIEIG